MGGEEIKNVYTFFIFSPDIIQWSFLSIRTVFGVAPFFDLFDLFRVEIQTSKASLDCAYLIGCHVS